MSFKLSTGVLALGIVSLLAPMASATVIGTLRIGSEGQVTVDATSVDFNPAVGINMGSFIVTDDTLTYDAGSTLAVGTEGQVTDFTNATPFPLMSFFAFSSIPALTFDLTSVGPGSANTSCAGLAIGESCSAVAGSPFLLTRTASGSSVTLSAFGTVQDSTPVVSSFIGAFTTQIAGQTPGQIQATIAGGGAISSSFSGEFIVTPNAVPEPGTVSLLIGGGALLALGRRKFRKA